jgi:hypothetical protein
MIIKIKLAMHSEKQKWQLIEIHVRMIAAANE